MDLFLCRAFCFFCIYDFMNSIIGVFQKNAQMKKSCRVYKCCRDIVDLNFI